MDFHFPTYALAYVVSTILAFITAAMTWRRRANPGSVTFSLLMLSLCAWSFASVFEAGAATVANKLFWSKWQYIGIPFLPPLWMIFTFDFTNWHILHKRNHWMLFVIPFITLGLAFTNELHGLLWSEISIPPGALNIGVYDHGTWFYVHIAYSYLMMLAGSIRLFSALFKYPFKKRRQIYIVLFATIIGWTANILYVAHAFPIQGLDITPISFTFITFMLAWNISRFRLFDIVPIARDLLIDNMAEGVIVLDRDDIVVDINPAAIEIINDEDCRAPLGKSVWQVFHKHYARIKKFRGKSDFATEFQLNEDPPRYVNLNSTEVQDEDGQNIGQLITIRDITRRKLGELREAEQRKLAEALADTAAVINSSLELEEVLEKILENVGKVVPHDSANISLVDKNGTVRFVKIKGYEKYGTEKIVPTITCQVEEIHNLKTMAKTGRALLNPDTDADPLWKRDMPGASWIKSYMGAPIIAKGKLLGFINLDAATPNFFKKVYLDRLEAFAHQAATAIENAQMFREILEHANEVSILYEVGLAVSSGLGLEKTIKALFEQLRRMAKIDLFYIAILNEGNDEVSFTMFEGNGKQKKAAPLSLRNQPSLTRYVLEKGETVYIPDSQAPDAEYPECKVVKLKGHNERSILGIPLKPRNEILGVLFLQADPPQAYNTEQIRLIETIANEASIAMDNARLFERVQRMAITDSLTGAYNRNYFYDFGEREIGRAYRYKKPLTLLMLDIDHFKLVNDRFGHLTGDQTLKMVVQACTSALRQADVLCRFGGEEFTILLPETGAEKAAVVAERIRQVVEKSRLPSEQGEVAVTVSLGVAQLGEEKMGLLELVSWADQALYAAKAAGRNCVRVYSP